MPLKSTASPTKDMGFFYDEDVGVSSLFPGSLPLLVSCWESWVPFFTHQMWG